MQPKKCPTCKDYNKWCWWCNKPINFIFLGECCTTQPNEQQKYDAMLYALQCANSIMKSKTEGWWPGDKEGPDFIKEILYAYEKKLKLFKTQNESESKEN